MRATLATAGTTATLAALIVVAPGLSARQGLDRTRIPAPGKAPDLRVPSWTKSAFPNGPQFVVSERPGLPLVSFTITFVGGANQFEPADKKGVASLTASMLSEGTKTRDGEALSRALQLLGTSVNASIGAETGSIGFVSTTRTFQPTLEILVDMLRHSTFPEAALERLRAQRLVALTQANAQPGAIADRVFNRVLYGDAHQMGQRATEASLKAITRADVVAFHDTYFQPARAIVTIVGDVNAVTAKSTVERVLVSGWPSPSTQKGPLAYPPVPPSRPMTIYLVDKPGAAQSTFSIGNPGPPRNTPDYFALQVMNTILGGQFQSRLNANIREEKGYSYGVRSGFGFGKGPGAFETGGDIVTASTDKALVEFMKELRGIQGSRPVTDEELQTAKDKLIQSLPGQFASAAQVNGAITSLLVQELPENYYQTYAKAVSAITKDDVVRVAKKYIDLEHLAIVIVGDRATIEAPLRATGIAPIVLLDTEGTPKS